MLSYRGRNTRVALSVGLLIVLGIFLRKRMESRPLNRLRVLPINQNIGISKYRALLPYIQAQAVHESGNFKSSLALSNFNLFGMKKPRIRPFVGSKDAPGAYMKYASYSESVQDLLLWMQSVNFPVAVANSYEYALALKGKSYFEDSVINYTRGLNSALQKLQIEGETGFNIKPI